MNLPLLAMDARLATFPPLFPARVVSVHRHVVNLAPAAAADCLFSLSDDTVPHAPRQLRCAQLPSVSGEAFAARLAAPTPLFDCTLRLPSSCVRQSALHFAWQALADAAVPAPDAFHAAVQSRLQQGITALLQALERGASALPPAALLGLGMGLTPSGDDFLCGLLIALHLPESPFAAQLPRLRAQVLAALAATHAISAAFLRDAAAGQVSAPVQEFVAALCGKQALAPALEALVSLGHRSGYDLLSGILAGLPHYPDRRVYLCPCIAV